jgi:hypothetical protein
MFVFHRKHGLGADVDPADMAADFDTHDVLRCDPQPGNTSMRRRSFIAGLAATTITWPRTARGQQKIWKVGILGAVSGEDFSGPYAAFIQGMRELGHVEGNDFIVEWRSAKEHYERFPELIAELMGLNVDVIVSATSSAYRDLQRAINTIPIIMLSLTDPVGSGFVASLKHPVATLPAWRLRLMIQRQSRESFCRWLCPTSPALDYSEIQVHPLICRSGRV